MGLGTHIGRGYDQGWGRGRDRTKVMVRVGVKGEVRIR